MFQFKPIKQTFIKSKNSLDKISEEGYDIIGNIGKKKLEQLYALYNELHAIQTSNGAMFYSIYSQDLEYRKIVHESINKIIHEIFNQYFVNYKNVINSFIIKVPGDKSEFALHQDSTIFDETKYSQLTLWIPLQDTNINNGTLCVVPKTHKLFSPYRGVTIPSPYSDYEDEIRKYLVPIDLKAGDILAFDYRLVHYSPSNLSNTNRIVIMCGLFEKNATFEICYKDANNDVIEIYEQDEDYLLTNKGFHLACHCKPETGRKIKEIRDSIFQTSKEEFIEFAKNNNLKKSEFIKLQNTKLNSFTVIDAKYKASIKEIIKDKLENLIK